jgi:hypothetical protein
LDLPGHEEVGAGIDPFFLLKTTGKGLDWTLVRAKVGTLSTLKKWSPNTVLYPEAERKALRTFGFVDMESASPERLPIFHLAIGSRLSLVPRS